MESKKQFENVVSLNLEKFAKLQGELLNLERTCEVERAQDLVRAHSSDARELEKRGLALRRVVAAESRTGLYGRTVITYTKEKSVPLPATSISNGEIGGPHFDVDDYDLPCMIPKIRFTMQVKCFFKPCLISKSIFFSLSKL
jgi:hypothetical protein